MPIIQKTARNKKEELILSDRILDGCTYEEIIKRYYDEEFLYFGERYKRAVTKWIKPLLIRFYKNVEKEMGQGVHNQKRI